MKDSMRRLVVDPPCPVKEAEHAEIERQVEEYLKSGGVIKTVERGEGVLVEVEARQYKEMVKRNPKAGLAASRARRQRGEI